MIPPVAFEEAVGAYLDHLRVERGSCRRVRRSAR